MALHREFRYFGFERVPNRSSFGEESQEVFKVSFGVVNNPMNLAVTNLLIDREWKLDEHVDGIGVAFSQLHLKSKHIELRPHLSVQIWILHSGPERFRSVSPMFYRGTQAMVLVLDPLHSKRDVLRYDNSLRMVLERLREMETMLNVTPPKACQGVFIVAVGTWPSETPVSKDQFLEQCAQAFTLRPIEYHEITEENATTVGDHLVRRLCQLQRISLKEDGPRKSPSFAVEQQPPASKFSCIIS